MVFLRQFKLLLSPITWRFEELDCLEGTKKSDPQKKGALTSYARVRKRRAHETGLCSRLCAFD
jgi:hypothetical protein